ncbi:MAG: hypothetical protein RLZZ330_1173 [Actinomycetota bacterium]|jgi:pyrroline-5-carboxylate reductase
MATTAILGVGSMGLAILEGLLGSDSFNDEVVVVVRKPERALELQDVYGVKNLPIAEGAKADTLILTAKPQDMAKMVDEIAPHINPGTLVISVAAGITTKSIEARLPQGVSVVRVMPNTPSLVGEGMSVLSAGAGATHEALSKAEAAMACIGKTLVVDESLQSAATGVSGSGPAYIFYVAEAMIAAGEKLGLTAEDAKDLTIQTIFGAAKLLRESDDSAETLRKKVTSPNGTTAQAIARFEAAELQRVFFEAMKASHDRSIEMSKEFSGE